MYTAIYSLCNHASSTVLVMHTQYFFGADVLVAPVTQPVDNITQMVEKEIWIPEVSCTLAQANTQDYKCVSFPFSTCFKYHDINNTNPWPNCDIIRRRKNFLSTSFLPSPFSTPMQGTFISWFSGEMISGPQIITRNFSLSEIPVYVRAGAIIPMRTDNFCRFTCLPFVSLIKLLTLFSFLILAPLGSAQEIPSKLKFVVFIGDAKS